MGQTLIKRFVGYSGNYMYPLEQKSITSNYANVKTRTTPLAGFDGGYDELGIRRAPQEIGTLQTAVKLIAANGVTTQTLADEWRAMAGWGPGRLLMVPLESSDRRYGLRWAYGRLTYATANLDAEASAHVYVDATATYNVPDPGWYGVLPGPAEPSYNAGGNLYMDDDNLLDGSWVWGGPRAVATLDSGQTMTVTNSGTRVTRPVITITASAPMTGFGMARYDPFDQIVDEWRYDGTLAVGEQLVLDCESFSVRKQEIVNEVAVFGDFKLVTGLGWHELPAGTTTLLMRGPVSAATVSVEFFDSWY